MNDKGIQAVLKEVDNEELALALKTASEELKQKIFKNMSERAAQLIAEDMQYMGPVRVSDVEAAQQKIVELGAPELAHDDEIRRISSLPEAQHVAEIAKLHESKQGADDSENGETDKYLGSRSQRKGGVPIGLLAVGKGGY